MLNLKKKSLLLIILILIFAACKPKHDNTLSLSAVDLKDDNHKEKGWSKAFLKKNLSDCIERSGNKLSAAETYNYCQCMMDKVQEKYPDENDAVNKATKEELAAIQGSCLTSDSSDKNNSTIIQQWSDTDKREFITSCSDKMNGSLGTVKAKEYCECMLGKIMSESPDVNQSGNISKSLLKNWGTDCLK